MNSFLSYLQTPIGLIEIKANDEHILSVLFLDDNRILDENSENEISLIGKQQLEDYFANKRSMFDLPLFFASTEFQQKVWLQLQTIPFGKTISYLQLALDLGDEKCIRAAASANGKNPFAIVVPCHRVIGKDGSLTGYAGGLWRKQWLLEHEGNLKKQTTLF
ncbi:MAG TPA: methylated-DNA--[protein]-cysteine S-methyltransferase [Chitinophagales bacterium]|nr:methylated-DNA--[protein]-cysteine S-methyltransferase [Chitinophagales bacterium]